MHETIEDFEGKIFLSRSDLERANDRLNWSRRMKQKGYVPASQVSSDEYRQSQTAFALAQHNSAYALFKNFTAPENRSGARRGGDASEDNLGGGAASTQAPSRSARLAGEAS